MFKEAMELTQEKLNKLNNEFNQIIKIKYQQKKKKKDIERTKKIIKEWKNNAGEIMIENYNLSIKRYMSFSDQCNEKDFTHLWLSCRCL